MASVNKVIVLGNVGKDPEIRYDQGGNAIANFSVAASEKWVDKAGTKQEHTEWFNVEVFGKVAQVVRDYVTRGKQVYIEGSLRTSEYKDRDGNQKKSVRVRVSGPSSKLVLLGGRSEASTAREDHDPADDIETSEVPF